MPTTAYLFDAEGQDRAIASLGAGDIAAVGEQQLLWIDILKPDAAEMDRLLHLLSVPALLERDMRARVAADTKELSRPRLDVYENCFHLTVQAIQERAGSAHGLGAAEVEFVIWANILLTLHSDAVAFLTNFEQRIKGDSHFGTFDAPSLLGALLNWHVTGYFRAMETIENEVDRIDDAALRLRRSREERNLLTDLVRLRRRLALVRRTLLPHREVYATLARPLFASVVTEDATTALALVYERAERAVEATENGRELILGSFDIFTTQTALRTNEVVKALTVISALLLPAGVIASLASLFIRAPVYDLGRVGFWEVIGGMGFIGAGFLVVARKRNWM